MPRDLVKPRPAPAKSTTLKRSSSLRPPKIAFNPPREESVPCDKTGVADNPGVQDEGSATKASAGNGGDAMLNALPVAGYRTDADGWIKFYNSAASELWGCTPVIENSRWCGSSRLFSPDGSPMAREDSPTALSLREGKVIRSLGATLERPDGRRVSIAWYATPLRDAWGRIVGAISLLVDVQDQWKNTDESERIAAIVGGSSDAIISETRDGIVTSWNVGATRMFDYTSQQMIGQPVARIIPVNLQDEERDLVARLARGEDIDHFDTVGLAKDGREIPISVAISSLRDGTGDVVGVSKVARDITERKQAETALRTANEQAQQARLEEAESANRAKTEFLAVMSHEIRTPLNSINGFVDLLTNSTELTPQQRRYAELVKSASSALLTIVNDILYFSKVETGQLDLEPRPFSVAALLRDTVAIVTPSAAEKNLSLNLTIERGVPSWSVGDQARLRQVLLNLLNNAVKFTERGLISINARSQVTTEGRESIRFSIADTGIGIAAELQHRLFKPFSQADSSVSRQYGGTGLGLAICKRLVELMGGEIGIISDLGQGSTVWFTICLPQASGPEPDVDKPTQDTTKHKARILVIDDIDTNLEIVEAFLQDNGYHVDCVGSGLDGIQLLGSTHYDLILMDIQMPIMDGIAATKRIRALMPPICDIPIIAMTGNVLPQQVRSFLEAGMNDHVGKPIQRAKLYNNILRWLPRTAPARDRIEPNSGAFDDAKLDEFILAVGAEKATRIAQKFLFSFDAAFKRTLLEAQREAHDLINAAGVLGLDRFVDACRQAIAFKPSDDPERGRGAMEKLRAAQSETRQTYMIRLLPKLTGDPLRARA